MSGRPWTPEEDASALRGWARGDSIADIAIQVQRTGKGVAARLRLISDTPPPPLPPPARERLATIRAENARRVREAHAAALRGSGQWP